MSNFINKLKEILTSKSDYRTNEAFNTAVNELRDSIWHINQEQPDHGSMCLVDFGCGVPSFQMRIMYYDEKADKFISNVYPHKTGEHTIHGHNKTETIDIYKKFRDEVLRSEINIWADMNDIIYVPDNTLYAAKAPQLDMIEKDGYYICTKEEMGGDCIDGYIAFEKGGFYTGEQILAEYSKREIRQYYLNSFRKATNKEKRFYLGEEDENMDCVM